ncbi:acyl-CoA thioesterase [Ideonella oryzae]|uniref:Acyl-CoA thioesterase n=1 Tax=Ideonella oryzae TaxID=2937441 RepID=A0ABT1BIS9_9BURK|nr:thioesterase family protein [Ideonella oryzae]MCO5976018.1 acyl-CoA thioesterase [Ideonella oryzae]
MVPSLTPPSNQPLFEARRQVRFGDCDPAGIVYYPRYMDLINSVIEDWWAQAGLSWHAELPRRGLFTPLSHLETQFLRPSRMGDTLTATLWVESLQRSSIRLQLLLSAPGPHQERLVARVRQVCVDRDTQAPCAWPRDVRAQLSTWLPGAQPAG